MAHLLDISIEEAYQHVFGDEPSSEALERISFLESVVTGEVFLDNRQFSIEEALDRERNRLEQTKDHEEYLVRKTNVVRFEAMEVMRRWYKVAEKTSKQQAKAEIVQHCFDPLVWGLFEGDFENSMEVLYRHRISTILKPLEDAIKAKDRKDKTIRTISDLLLELDNEDVKNGAVDKISAYNAELRQNFDAALQSGKEKEIIATAQILVDSGVPYLRDYVQKSFKAYETTKQEKVFLGFDKEGQHQQKEISSTVKYAVEDNKVVSYTAQKMPWKKMAIGTAIAVSLGLAGVVGAYFLNSSEKSAYAPQEQQNYTAQK